MCSRYAVNYYHNKLYKKLQQAGFIMTWTKYDWIVLKAINTNGLILNFGDIEIDKKKKKGILSVKSQFSDGDFAPLHGSCGSQ